MNVTRFFTRGREFTDYNAAFHAWKFGTRPARLVEVYPGELVPRELFSARDWRELAGGPQQVAPHGTMPRLAVAQCDYCRDSGMHLRAPCAYCATGDVVARELAGGK